MFRLLRAHFATTTATTPTEAPIEAAAATTAEMSEAGAALTSREVRKCSSNKTTATAPAAADAVQQVELCFNKKA